MDENDKTLLETTDFISRSFGGSKALPAHVYRRAGAESAGSAKSRRRGGSAYLIIRLAVCAVCFCGVLGLKLKGDEKALAVISDLTSGQDNEGRDEDRLGRLKFVELPSIIEVFAPSKAALLPVNPYEIQTADDGRTLILKTDEGAAVLSPADGVVRGTGEDEALGRYVTVAASGDMEFTVYGFSEIFVENGQPVKQKQRLGALEGGEASVRVYRNGRPIEPADLFGVGKAG